MKLPVAILLPHTLLLAAVIATGAAAQDTPADMTDPSNLETTDWPATSSDSHDESQAEPSDSLTEAQDDASVHDDVATPESAESPMSETEDAAVTGKQIGKRLKGFLAGLLVPVIEERIRKAVSKEDAVPSQTDEESVAIDEGIVEAEPDP